MFRISGKAPLFFPYCPSLPLQTPSPRPVFLLRLGRTGCELSAILPIDSATQPKQHNTKVHAIIPLNLDGYIFSNDWAGAYRAQIRSRLAADFTRWETEPGKFETQVQNVIRALRLDEGAR